MAARPHVEKLDHLGKKGDLHSRRLALSYLQTREAVSRLFDTVAHATETAPAAISG
jgi:large subunit ribosomal protein L17